MSYIGAVKQAPPSMVLGNGYMGVSPEFWTVLYRPGDLVGFVCSWLCIVPNMILVAHLTLFLSRRNANDLFIAGGQVFNEALNVCLKSFIQQSRPLGPVLNLPEETHGMPSSHSQFMGYVSFVETLKAIRGKHIPKYERIVRVVMVWTLTLGVGFSRYYLHYHSLSQVIIGITVGFMFGAVWASIQVLLKKLRLYQWALTQFPFVFFCVKQEDYDVRKEYQEKAKQD